MTTDTERDAKQSPRQAAIRVLAGIAIAMTALTTVMLASRPADAQQRCLLHETAQEQLAKRYQEDVAGRGLADNGKAMFELYTSEGGTWTLVVTDVQGRSCVIGSGVGWVHDQALTGQPA